MNSRDQVDMDRLIAAIECFRRVRRTIPLDLVIAFLHVALDQGKGVSDYVKKAGASDSVMSRRLHNLGDSKQSGLKLISAIRSPAALNRLEHYLTEHGRAVLTEVICKLDG